MSSNNGVAIALDVGGTSVKAGLVDQAGRLVWPLPETGPGEFESGTAEPRIFPIDSIGSAEAVLNRFAEILTTLRRAAGAHPVAGIGVGMPGPFDYTTGLSLMRGLGKYDRIYGINLADDWRRRVDLPAALPVRFINDAAAFGLGEALYGSAAGQSRVMAITLGTGCGSAFVVDGRHVTGGDGVPSEGQVYALSYRGEIIDEWISRRGILRLWRELGGGVLRAGEPDPRGENSGPSTASEPFGPDVKDLAMAAYAGNPVALHLFDRWGEMLVEALGPVVERFRPDCLVVGGQIARSLHLFGAPLAARCATVGCRVVGSTNPAASVRGAASLIWTGPR